MTMSEPESGSDAVSVKLKRRTMVVGGRTGINFRSRVDLWLRPRLCEYFA